MAAYMVVRADSHEAAAKLFENHPIDIGCHAHLRKLQGRFNEVDLSATDAKEKLRSAPFLELSVFEDSFLKAPADAEIRLTADDIE